MVDCGVRGCKKDAQWRHIRYKQLEDKKKYLCDACLMKQPDAVNLIDKYKWIGG